LTMDKIQLIFFFISGFVVSRLIIKARLSHRIVYWFIGKRHLSITRILFYLIAISAFLSFFIPNAITVDSGGVYWTEVGGGRIRLVRPK